MCLGVPGQVTDIAEDALGLAVGHVRFGGITKQVSLAYTPEVVPGDWVLVHVGFAITKIDEEEARAVFETLRQLDELQDLDLPGPS